MLSSASSDKPPPPSALRRKPRVKNQFDINQSKSPSSRQTSRRKRVEVIGYNTSDEDGNFSKNTTIKLKKYYSILHFHTRNS